MTFFYHILPFLDILLQINMLYNSSLHDESTFWHTLQYHKGQEEMYLNNPDGDARQWSEGHQNH